MKLYEEIGHHLGITSNEVRERIVKGESLVQAYYEWKYNWTPGKTDVPF